MISDMALGAVTVLVYHNLVLGRKKNLIETRPHFRELD